MTQITDDNDEVIGQTRDRHNKMDSVPTRDVTKGMSGHDGSQLLDELGDDLMSFDVSESGTNATNPQDKLPSMKDTLHQLPLQEVHTLPTQQEPSLASSSATTTPPKSTESVISTIFSTKNNTDCPLSDSTTTHADQVPTSNTNNTLSSSSATTTPLPDMTKSPTDKLTSISEQRQQSQKPSDIFSQIAENLKTAQSRGKGVVSIIDYL